MLQYNPAEIEIKLHHAIIQTSALMITALFALITDQAKIIPITFLGLSLIFSYSTWKLYQCLKTAKQNSDITHPPGPLNQQAEKNLQNIHNQQSKKTLVYTLASISLIALMFINK